MKEFRVYRANGEQLTHECYEFRDAIALAENHGDGIRTSVRIRRYLEQLVNKGLRYHFVLDNGYVLTAYTFKNGVEALEYERVFK